MVAATIQSGTRFNGNILADKPLRLHQLFEISGEWFAAAVQETCEKTYVNNLKILGFPAYVPLTKVIRRYPAHRSVKESLIPLWPGYIFASGRQAEAELKNQKAGVFSILHQPEQDQLKRDLLAIETALGINPCMTSCAIPTTGDKVTICSGPFMGYQAIVSSSDPNKCVVVLETLGQAVLTTLPTASLQLVE